MDIAVSWRFDKEVQYFRQTRLGNTFVASDRSEVHQAIDMQCSLFERARQESFVEPMDYVDGVEAPYESELAYELSRIALYYEWQEQTREASRTASKPNAKSSRLCAEHYLHAFNLRAPLQPVGLARTEFQCRLEHGDDPNVDEYVNRFPQFDNEIQVALGEELRSFSPVRIRVLEEDFVVFLSYLRMPTVFGRQHSDDPEPWSVAFPDEFQCRIVVAPKLERRIGRQHARIAPYSADGVSVTALNEKSATLIDGEELRYGAKATVKLPFELSLGPRLVQIG